MVNNSYIWCCGSVMRVHKSDSPVCFVCEEAWLIYDVHFIHPFVVSQKTINNLIWQNKSFQLKVMQREVDFEYIQK